MNFSPDISLILPAYNEAGTIQNTIAEAVEFFSRRRLRHEIIVAADGDDGTREAATEMAARNPVIRVLGSKERRGKGRGVRLAAEMATGEIIGYADADNKVPIEEYDNIVPWFTQGFDLVIGSRGLAQSRIGRKQPLYRQIGSRGFGVAMRAITGVWDVRDTQCGFKFFRKPVAKHIFRIQQIDGYMFDVEILALARHFGYPVKEVPILWRDDGDSRLELFRGNVRNMQELFRIRASLRHVESRVAVSKTETA